MKTCGFCCAYELGCFPFLVPCHHQEYLRGLSKPAFATNIGKGDNPSYLPGIEDRLVLLDAQPLFESVSTSPLSELKQGWPRGSWEGNLFLVPFFVVGVN